MGRPPPLEVAVPLQVAADVALAVDGATRFLARSRLREMAVLAWSRAGLGSADASQQTGGTGDQIVVQLAPDAVRLRLEGQAIRALAWVRRTDLARAPTKRSELATVPAGAPKAKAGVTVLPGAALDLGESEHRMRHVKAALSEVSFEGWLPEENLSDTWVPEDEPADRTVTGRVRQGTAVVDATGAMVARFELAKGWRRLYPDIDVETEAEAPAGFVAVRWSGDRAIVRGYVPLLAYSRQERSSLHSEKGISFDDVGTMSDTKQAEIAAGTWLYDEPGGRPVAVALAAVPLFMGLDIDTHAAWCSGRAMIPLMGFMSVAVHCDALAD
jgi:hypothetical protein